MNVVNSYVEYSGVSARELNGTLAVVAEQEPDTSDPLILTSIYQDKTNTAIWSRQLHQKVAFYSRQLCESQTRFELRVSSDIQTLPRLLARQLPSFEGENKHAELLGAQQAFADDVCLLADMYSELFELSHVGVRLAVLTKAMCPKFHVDRVPVRLVSTYVGACTEYLDNHDVLRGFREINNGATMRTVDAKPRAHIRQAAEGDVMLLKGELWEGNEGRGAVHRSPVAYEYTPRLVLTLDFANE